MVWRFRVSSCWAVTGPTPWMERMGRGRKNSTFRDSGMTVRPSGFWKSLASFARNLLEPIPIVAFRLRSERMRALMAVATVRDA